MTDGRTLGIVDWGVGGIGLLKHLDIAAPGLPVIYWSDTGTVPYGQQRTADLRTRLRYVVAELHALGCTEVVLACHSASTVVHLLGEGAIPVSGIIDHALRAVPADLDGPIGVVGGRRTIASGIYRRRLAANGLRAISRVAQPLSAHIEAGRITSSDFRRDLRRIVAPIYGARALILACTHYPAASAEFASVLPGTALIDPVVRLAAEFTADSTDGKAATRTFFTTGEPAAMRAAALLAWGYPIDDIVTVH